MEQNQKHGLKNAYKICGIHVSLATRSENNEQKWKQKKWLEKEENVKNLREILRCIAMAQISAQKWTA